MKTYLKSFLCVGVLWFMGMVPAAPLFGAAPVPPALPPAGPNGMLPFPSQSPVTFFRQLLALTPAERQARLASRPAANREVIERKLREYEAMPAADRDARLRALEFHHYLSALLRAPAAVRSNWLAQIPAEFRAPCEERLRLWVVLPPEIQSYMLERQSTLQWLTRTDGMSPQERQQALAALPAALRQAVERDAARWQAMSPAQRDQAWRGVREMFDLSPRDQRRVLAQVTQTQREQTEKMVQNLGPLTPAQRERYVEGWRKFSQLDPAQRARFIQGWERWKTMPEAEREVWRRLATRVPAVPALPAPRNDPKG
jgi:hypothetical protein